MKVHKRVQSKILVSNNEAVCGLEKDLLSDLQLVWRWGNVTCKSCLKKRV